MLEFEKTKTELGGVHYNVYKVDMHSRELKGYLTTDYLKCWTVEFDCVLLDEDEFKQIYEFMKKLREEKKHEKTCMY